MQHDDPEKKDSQEDEGAPAPRSGLPRALEATLAGAALAVLAPALTVLGLLVRLGSPGPALFRQQRVGRGGESFVLLKLRTMRSAPPGEQITATGDPRITPLGRFLRRTKLDELPSLWNIVRGDLSLVGPRPEVPRYVDLEDPLWQTVLAVRPGLTDPTSIELRDEERLLSAAPGDRDAFYRQRLLPYKLRSSARYLARRTAWSDLAVLSRTALAVLGRRPAPLEPADLDP